MIRTQALSDLFSSQIPNPIPLHKGALHLILLGIIQAQLENNGFFYGLCDQFAAFLLRPILRFINSAALVDRFLTFEVARGLRDHVSIPFRKNIA